MSAPRTGSDFDEGSTTITQVQGLRGCRNAGIPVPKEIIDKAVEYIRKCTLPDGGVQYSSKGGGGRPAISAAAIACLFNAGDYDSEYVPKLLEYCQQQPATIPTKASATGTTPTTTTPRCCIAKGARSGKTTATRSSRSSSAKRPTEDRQRTPTWNQGYIGPIYTTAINLTILQLENASLPIYQR